MPVPKQKQGRIRTHTRRSANMKISAAAQSTCPRCGAVKLPHQVCPSCGSCGLERLSEIFFLL